MSYRQYTLLAAEDGTVTTGWLNTDAPLRVGQKLTLKERGDEAEQALDQLEDDVISKLTTPEREHAKRIVLAFVEAAMEALREQLEQAQIARASDQQRLFHLEAALAQVTQERDEAQNDLLTLNEIAFQAEQVSQQLAPIVIHLCKYDECMGHDRPDESCVP